MSGTYTARFMNMHTNCPACGLTYEIEPGFFWGAMYISYALTVGISFVTAILIYFLTLSSNMWLYIGFIVGVLFILSPYNFRLSRAIMLYVFSPIKYDPEAVKHYQKEH